jgi:uncharacterized protein (TIGR04222 family)
MSTSAYSFETMAQAELWQRLDAHPFESSDRLDFTARLAREQGWTRDEARSAVAEYRKFCFLTATVGRCMTPSEIVDQVWHLHLTYTRDYWNVFCPQVLGCDLHHEPTRGNAGETAQFRECYADTLAEYHQHFGVPPERYWPGTLERFRAGERFRWIDRERHMVLPRPRLPAVRTRVAAMFAMLLVCIAPSAQAQSANPFDWTGGAFIALYLGLMVACAFATSFWRRTLRENGSSDTGFGLEPLEIAYLAGGNARVLDAAVADLMERGALEWDTTTRKFVATGQNAENLPSLLKRIFLHLPNEGQPAKLAGRLDDDLRPTVANLEARGLLLDAAARERARWLPLLIPAVLVLIGLTKIMLGLSRGKPIGFLLVLIIITAAISLVTSVVKSGTRSRAGDRALAQLQEQYSHTARAPRSGELPLAVALAGTAIMATTAYAAYHEARIPATSGSDSSGCSSGDSGGGGDGGGSGCGGCGGGGGD